MAYRRDSNERYKTVSCSTCAARPGEPCVTKTGNITVPHEPRQKEWWRRQHKAQQKAAAEQKAADEEWIARTVRRLMDEADERYFDGLRKKYGSEEE